MARRKARLPEEISADGVHLHEVLNEGTPLACVLIGGAALEQATMGLLRQFFVRGETSKNIFRESGALGEFRRCIEVAYCVGLIPTSIFDNLGKVVELRNLFAHSHVTLCFADSDVETLCNELTLPHPAYERFAKNARDRFQLAVSYIWTKLTMAALAVEKRPDCEEPKWVDNEKRD
jgi:DNA-binding MltR family transcriptional regulator